MEPTSLEVYLAMSKHLANKMIERHGEQALIGTQSFRALEPGEQMYIGNMPAKYMQGGTHWREPVMPLKNVSGAVHRPRAAACGVDSKYGSSWLKLKETLETACRNECTPRSR